MATGCGTALLSRHPVQRWNRQFHLVREATMLYIEPSVTRSEGSGQGKDDHFFAGHGTDVMVHTHHLHAGDLVDQRFQHRACQLQQLLPYLLDEIPPFSGDNDLPSCRSARVKTPGIRTTKRSLMKWA